MRLLQRLGYTNVTHYHGGMAEWHESGQRLERSAPTSAPVVQSLATPARAVEGGLLVTAFERATLGDLVLWWLIAIAGCAVVYWALSSTSWGLRAEDGLVPRSPSGLLTALYFSFVTATSVGFGDVVPLGAARALAIAEAVVGLLVFGAVVSKLVSRRQEHVVSEIHRIAFEDRLGRVQTDLHMVLAELQSIAEMCGREHVAEAQVRARVDSASGICLAELRTIHDLLYRPQSTPSEDVLQGILASLALMLGQLRDVLRCFSGRSSYLAANLADVGRLAEEICSECVPNRYATDLREWMDQVQAVARELA